ncbi:hypothetical protein GCM10009639_55330 [Kitasatospora putterlickiae]|uniref:Integrase n=1 Tax=Kitasatospora putterlickiae TaxID=221725 RepID=A0ABN1YE32_9ACTN
MGLLRPPWDTEGVDDYLPEENQPGGRENTTEPLDPRVVAPLLMWSIRVVEDLADDILAAWDERTRMTGRAHANPSSPEGAEALRAYLRPILSEGAPLPTATIRGNSGAARIYIAARTGSSLKQVQWAGRLHRLSRLAAERPGPCPLTTPVTGLIEGRFWRTSINFDEAGDLRRHLGTAAAVILLHLTGMRPQEVQALRSGCCPAPAPDTDGTTRHLIRSQVTGPADADLHEEEAAGPHLITGRHYRTSSTTTATTSVRARSAPSLGSRSPPSSAPSGSWNGWCHPANSCSAPATTTPTNADTRAA